MKMNFKPKVKTVHKDFTEQREQTTITIELRDGNFSFTGKLVCPYDVDVRPGTECVLDLVDWETQLSEWYDAKKKAEATA